MKKIAVFCVCMLLINTCYAREFECLMGAVLLPVSSKVEYVKTEYLVFLEKKKTSNILPFLACGVKFDL